MNFNRKKNSFIKSEFKKNGYVVLKKIFDKDRVKNIKKKLFIYLNKKKKKLNKREIHFAKNTDIINSIHNLKWPYIKNIKNNKKIYQIVKLLLDNNFKSFGAEVFAKPAKIGMAVPIHQDNFYWNISNSKGITIWIALNDSSKKNGALFYYKKSQKLGLLDHTVSFALGSSQKVKNLKVLKKYKKISPKLKAGDVLIHHCLVVHGSNKNKSNNNRVGLTLRYIGKNSKVDKKAKIKYERQLNKQFKFLN